MVKNRLILIISMGILFTLAWVGSAAGQLEYHLNYEWAKIWINQDGTIDLLYNMSVTCDSGVLHWVKVGQPNSDFTINETKDSSGQMLPATNVGDGVQVDVPDISSGQTTRFSVLTNVAKMIYEDAQNPGNVGMQFIPTWYDVNINNLRVLIVLPTGVTTQNVTTSVNWNNTLTEDGHLAIYWERQNLSPNQKYTFGVSFPKEYVQKYETQPSGVVGFLQQYGAGLLILGVSVSIIGAVVYVVRKRPYLLPTISMETLGIKHGLTAVEASYLLDVKPTMLVTEMLYSLLQKRAVWVESTTPSLKLKIMQPFQDETATPENPLQYYEIDFLHAIKEDGALDEEKLAKTVTILRDTTEEKLRGYCRRDTVDYYKNIVTKAWEQVEQAGTPELASKAYDEQLLWLFLDPNYQSRTQTAFKDRAFEPSPFWLWYWYSYQHYHPNPTYKPNVETPTQAAKPPTIPGADFANNIATAVEKTSNNIVTNLEKFANAIVPAPAPAKASHQPAHHGSSCVCACAACACVCACVSCACACAGGGAG